MKARSYTGKQLGKQVTIPFCPADSFGHARFTGKNWHIASQGSNLFVTVHNRIYVSCWNTRIVNRSQNLGTPSADQKDTRPGLSVKDIRTVMSLDGQPSDHLDKLLHEHGIDVAQSSESFLVPMELTWSIFTEHGAQIGDEFHGATDQRLRPGGAFAFADPERGLGVAYAMNYMREPLDVIDPRIAALTQAVYSSV